MWNACDPIISNAEVYRQFAIDALGRSNADMAKRVDGGDKLRDPNHTALNDSLTAIVFAWLAIEATLWIVGCAKLGTPAYTLLDEDLLENRLKALGITDAQLITDAARFRVLRKSLVHEQARDLGQGKHALYMTHAEAGAMVDIMRRIEGALGVRHPA